jgi:capsular exopolysaccharide synthesis family protein
VPRHRGKDSLRKEAFLSLRTSILFCSRSRDRNVILISSAGPQEGKSNCTTNLAKSLASAGDRVIILDCDLRRPTQHLNLEVPREPGITNYILSTEGEKYSQFRTHTEVSGLDLMPCGIIPPNPTEIVGMARFHELVRQLKQDYDWVLIDSPPSISLADTMVLAPMADMVVLVIKHNENDKDLIRRSVKKLREIDANLIGAVLNSVEIEKAYYKDYYHASYYYYAEEGEKRSKKRWFPNGDRKDEKKVVL